MTARSTFALFFCLGSLGAVFLAAFSCGGSSGAPAKDAGASDEYLVPLCGTIPCDYRSKTCCLFTDGGVEGGAATSCIDGTSASCGSGVGTFHCSGVIECPTGKVCCGVYDLTALTAGTSCLDAPCSSMGQFCRTTEECPSGKPCTPQTCGNATVLYLCGVLSQAPYNCMAFDGG